MNTGIHPAKPKCLLEGSVKVAWRVCRGVNSPLGDTVQHQLPSPAVQINPHSVSAGNNVDGNIGDGDVGVVVPEHVVAVVAV